MSGFGWGSLINTGSNQTMQIATNYLNRKDERQTWRKNANLQREFAQNGTTWQIDQAIANRDRIHPLISMGANPISATPQRIGGNAVAPRSNVDWDAIFNSKYNDKIRREQLRNMKLRNDLLAKEVNYKPNAGKAMLPGENGTPDANYEKPTLPTSQNMGTSSGVGPIAAYKIDKKGNLLNTLDKETAEALESDWFAGLKYIIKRIGEYAKNFSIGHVGNRLALIKFQNILRKEFKTLPKPDKGYTWRFNVNRGNWVLRKYGDRSGIFDHEKLNNYLETNTRKYR